MRIPAQIRALALTGVAGCSYPLGMIPGAAGVVARLGVTPRIRATREAVVLVEGWGANDSTWLLAGRVCTARGFHVRRFGYKTLGGSVEAEAERLAREVHLLSQAGFARIHLVGHSLGGIIVSLAASEFIEAALLGQVITVASPHRGSALGHLPAGRLGAEVAHGSALLARLREDVREAITRGVRFTAIAAKDDVVVRPRDARLEVEGVRNEELAHANHFSVTFDPRCLELLAELLEGGDAQFAA